MRDDDGGLYQYFRDALPRGDWQRVETALTGGGVPDLNYCFPVAGSRLGVEGWVECKKTNAFAVRMRPEQVAWLTRRARHGGRVWIAVRRISVREHVDELYLIPGAYAREVKLQGVRSIPPGTFSWAGGPGGWSWSQIERLLRGECFS